MNYQDVIFNTDFKHFKYLEFSLNDGDLATVTENCLSSQKNSKALLAFGPRLSEKYFAQNIPKDLNDFQEISQKKFFPSTQRDLFIWVQGETIADVFDRSREIDQLLPANASLKLEKDGFIYHDSRDLSGFVDGSANPQGQKALDAAIIPEGPCQGGSIILTQQWNHKLDMFNIMPLAEQEKVIGRTKPDSIEFSEDEMPENSHVAKTDISGTKIFRRSTPFGNLQEHGLYFLAFSCEQKRFDLQLKSMAGSSGSHDRIMDFSTPMTGSYFYCPSIEQLKSIT
jgi:putative iron-dependent peroxidase